MTAAIVHIPSADPGLAPARRGAPTPVSPETYRRRRLVAVAVVVGLLLGLASFGRQADATSTPEAEARAAVKVVVQPGDTLWQIARTLSPGGDPRPLVSALGEIAGGGALQPGQLLVIPGHLLG